MSEDKPRPEPVDDALTSCRVSVHPQGPIRVDGPSAEHQEIPGWAGIPQVVKLDLPDGTEIVGTTPEKVPGFAVLNRREGHVWIGQNGSMTVTVHVGPIPNEAGEQ